jgi:hypothetical protein
MRRIPKKAKVPVVSGKPEAGILFCQGVEKELIEWLRSESKRLGYSWTHEYLNKLLRQLKDQSDAIGSNLRKTS